MVSKLFYGVIAIGVFVWYASKDFKLGLLPIFIYIFIRIILNLILLVTEAGNRP